MCCVFKIKIFPTLGLSNLGDGRHKKFTDSLLGIIESTLGEGPIYFNCFPNFFVALSDINVLKALTLNIQTQGYDRPKISKSSHHLLGFI